MSLRLYLLVITTSVTLVAGICNVGLGDRKFGDAEIKVLRANKGPVPQEEHMTLTFDYKVDPTDKLELTFVKFQAFPVKGGCMFEWLNNFDLKKEFNVTTASQAPVKQFNATATIYGIRRIEIFD
nr:uncharacterized protein LOC109412440 [Aedes albopictus]